MQMLGWAVKGAKTARPKGQQQQTLRISGPKKNDWGKNADGGSRGDGLRVSVGEGVTPTRGGKRSRSQLAAGRSR